MAATLSPVSPSSPGATDAGPRWNSYRGVDGARVTSADATSTPLYVTNAPGTTQYLWLTDLLLSADTAMRVDVKEETTDTILASIYLAANVPYNWVPRGKLQLATAGKRVKLITSVSGNIAATALYAFEP